MSLLAHARPKEVDSVLVRLPSSLRERAASVADERFTKVSANALYTAAVLHATIIYGELPRIGNPQNLLALIDEIDRACSTEDDLSVFGAFNEADWRDVTWLLERLVESNFIVDVRVRTDIKAASTIVYDFALTKTGRQLWPELGQTIRYAMARQGSENLGAATKNR